MSFLNAQSLFDPIESTKVGPKSKVTVEVILLKKSEDELTVRLDETSRPRIIPRKGVKILSQVGNVATLSMSEKRAVDYSLV